MFKKSTGLNTKSIEKLPANMPIKHWKNKQVWIIGASSGIGKALAELLLDKGAIVYVSARSEKKLLQIQKQYVHATAIPLDASDSKQIKNAYDKISANASLDTMIYAAAMYEPMTAEKMDKTLIKQSMQLNYGGAIDSIATVLPDMQAKKAGHIAIIASVAGYFGMPNSIAYGPTKAALINLSENLYAELYHTGVAVHVINPGFVKSPLTDKNNFEMPAIISPQTAAKCIIKGFAKGSFEITFPKHFTYTLKLIQAMPYAIKLPLFRRMGWSVVAKNRHKAHISANKETSKKNHKEIQANTEVENQNSLVEANHKQENHHVKH